MTEPKEKESIYKVPGSFDGAPWRRSTQEYALTLMVPKEKYRYVKPLLGQENKYFVAMFIPVTDATQAEELLKEKADELPELPETPSDEIQGECSIEQLADILTVSLRHAHFLVAKGVAVKIARGRYDIIKSVQGYISELRKTQYGDAAYNEERSRKMKVQREKAEIELLEKKKVLVNFEEVKKEVERNNLNLKNKLLYLPTKAAPQVIGCTVAEAKEVLDNYLRESLAELAGLDVSAFANKRGKQDIKSTAKVHRKRMGRRKPGPKSRK